MMYRLLRALWRVALRIFFRRIEIDGERPEGGPVLIVANHTNGLVDALLVLCALERTVTITAKNALTANRLLAFLMWALGVVEFHRRQDSGASPRRNLDAIDQCRAVLAAGGCVLIFPEGISHSDPQMRPFKTGAARVALSGIPGLRVVPAALHYEAKDRFRSSALIRFGEAFTPAGDALDVTRDMDRRLRELTVNVERRREAVLLHYAADLLSDPAPLGDPVPLANRVAVLQRLRDGYERLCGDPRVGPLGQRIREHAAELRRLGVAPAEVHLSMNPARAAFFVLREAELFCLGLPIALWGWIHHALPALLLRWTAVRLSKDKDHWASNVVVPSLVILPVCYLLQIGVAVALLPAWIAAIYGLTLPCAGLVALLHGDRTGGALRRARTFLNFLVRPSLRRRLAAESAGIATTLKELDDDRGSR